MTPVRPAPRPSGQIHFVRYQCGPRPRSGASACFTTAVQADRTTAITALPENPKTSVRVVLLRHKRGYSATNYDPNQAARRKYLRCQFWQKYDGRKVRNRWHDQSVARTVFQRQPDGGRNHDQWSDQCDGRRQRRRGQQCHQVCRRDFRGFQAYARLPKAHVGCHILVRTTNTLMRLKIRVHLNSHLLRFQNQSART